jgi:calcium-dependent protein kinase
LGEEAKRDVNLYYEISKAELGKGSYGTVHMGRLKGTKVQRAIKIIDKSKVSNVERFRLEVEIMMRLNHPSILRLFDFFEDKKHVYLVLELCSGGELFDRIIEKKYYDETEARQIFKQIIKAIYYCHQNGVCHRDLKPENFIMVSKNDPYLLKVIDFGLSRTFPNEHASPSTDTEAPKELDTNKPSRIRRQTKAILKTKAGTPFYIAPEVLTGNYTEKCDVWSCGVILYILFCGYPPFYGENNKEILEAVKSGKLDFSTSEWKDKSKLAIDLVRKMIVAQDARLFADEVIKHSWMQAKTFKVDALKLKSITTNMAAFGKLSTLQKTILYFVAHNLYEEDVTFLHDYFYLFDTSDHGSITEAAFKTVLKDRLGTDSTAAGALFQGLDFFETKTLNYTQFLTCAINLESLDSEKKLLTVFQMADIDRDEKLSLADFERFLSIQFKYRPNLPAKLKQSLLHQFTEAHLEGSDFAAFKAKIFKDQA